MLHSLYPPDVHLRFFIANPEEGLNNYYGYSLQLDALSTAFSGERL